MNKGLITKAKILEMCRELIKQQGLEALNMRNIAKQLGISVSTLYHYFPSKSDLVLAVVEDVWFKVILLPDENKNFSSFLEYLEWLFTNIESGIQEYPNFFNYHALVFMQEDKAKGMVKMHALYESVTNSMRYFLKKDKNIQESRFNQSFTQKGFVSFIFKTYMASIFRGNFNYTYLLETVKRSIY